MVGKRNGYAAVLECDVHVSSHFMGGLCGLQVEQKQWYEHGLVAWVYCVLMDDSGVNV